jgi:hypothetical protein
MAPSPLMVTTRDFFVNTILLIQPQHGPNRRHCFQQFFAVTLRVHCHGNVFMGRSLAVDVFSGSAVPAFICHIAPFLWVLVLSSLQEYRHFFFCLEKGQSLHGVLSLISRAWWETQSLWSPALGSAWGFLFVSSCFPATAGVTGLCLLSHCRMPCQILHAHGPHVVQERHGGSTV